MSSEQAQLLLYRGVGVADSQEISVAEALERIDRARRTRAPEELSAALSPAVTNTDSSSTASAEAFLQQQEEEASVPANTASATPAQTPSQQRYQGSRKQPNPAGCLIS